MAIFHNIWEFKMKLQRHVYHNRPNGWFCMHYFEYLVNYLNYIESHSVVHSIMVVKVWQNQTLVWNNEVEQSRHFLTLPNAPNLYVVFLWESKYNLLARMTPKNFILLTGSIYCPNIDNLILDDVFCFEERAENDEFAFCAFRPNLLTRSHWPIVPSSPW